MAKPRKLVAVPIKLKIRNAAASAVSGRATAKGQWNRTVKDKIANNIKIAAKIA
jgi:hypothetical protein